MLGVLLLIIIYFHVGPKVTIWLKIKKCEIVKLIIWSYLIKNSFNEIVSKFQAPRLWHIWDILFMKQYFDIVFFVFVPLPQPDIVYLWTLLSWTQGLNDMIKLPKQTQGHPVLMLVGRNWNPEPCTSIILRWTWSDVFWFL